MILAVGSSSPPAFFFSQYIALATPAAKSLQSCPTLCDPIDVSPPGSPVSGILQARTLEWLLLALSISETFEYLESISCTCTCTHTHTHTAPVETLDWNFIEFVDLSLLFWDWVIFLLLIFQKGVWLFQPTLSLWISFCSQCSSGFSPFHQECDIYHQKPTHHSHSFFFIRSVTADLCFPFRFWYCEWEFTFLLCDLIFYFVDTLNASRQPTLAFWVYLLFTSPLLFVFPS